MTIIARVHDTDYGPMLLPEHDINQTGALLRTNRGVHHQHAMVLADILDSFPGDDKVFIDAGANIGAFTMALAPHVGARGRVHAFEPQPVLAMALGGTVALSEHWDRIRVHNVCLGDSVGAIEVPQYDYTQRLNFGSIEFGPEQIELIDQQRQHDPDRVEFVSMRTIDSFNFRRVDVMKLDVQRMEIEVLHGAVATLMRFRPVLFVEWVGHDLNLLRRAIEAHGYSVHSGHGDDWLCYPN